MNNPFFSFILKALSVLVFVLGIHLLILYLLKFPLFENKIILSYILNAFFCVGVFGLLYYLRDKYVSQLGFLFLGGSLIKFVVFFIVFNPHYKLDNVITKLEFTTFFIPYTISLILETFYLTKWLNKLD